MRNLCRRGREANDSACGNVLAALFAIENREGMGGDQLTQKPLPVSVESVHPRRCRGGGLRPRSGDAGTCGRPGPSRAGLAGEDLVIRIDFSPFFSAVVALGLASSGYFTETLRGGIQSIPRGHIEAARSTGMSGVLTPRFLVRRWRVRPLPGE